MSRTMIAVWILAAGVLAGGGGGCQRLPDGVMASLATAEQTLAVTCAEMDANRPPWSAADPNESPAGKAARLEANQRLLKRTMAQAVRNLDEVLLWAIGSTEGLPNDGK